ncbi:hypothetical protein C479_11830 [Halovivax asiaticus JCM 14624]|uniref:Uncharacterized protein n=1 Tax=Halovivax asiaticus JCM 14624 TaxID=1227490 RepID=M0BF59_9EURY|nr:DUF308 domain-containing protein [Halovivax asiaticus]ELZ09506.1 hypothetical protein C479_11830 [Halovivax asiaticus JCM 14624]
MSERGTTDAESGAPTAVDETTDADEASETEGALDDGHGEGGWTGPEAVATDEDGRTGSGAGTTDEGDWTDSRVGVADEDRGGLGRLPIIGLALLVAGIVLFISPSVAVLETDNRLLVAGVATVTIVFGLFSAADQRVTNARLWQPRDPEPGTQLPVPGDAFETLPQHEFRDRIRTRAVVSLVDATGLSSTAAEERIDDGSWTNDRLAAAAISEDVRPPLRSRLRARLTRSDIDDRERKRVMDEIASLRDGNRKLDVAVGEARSAANESRRATDETGQPPDGANEVTNGEVRES